MIWYVLSLRLFIFLISDGYNQVVHPFTCFQIQCRSCDTWGHMVCYGYLPGDPTVAKVDHMCYRCLKQRQEEDPVGALMLEGTLDLEALGDIALLRRAIYVSLCLRSFFIFF